MSSPRVSAVVTNYNYARYLGAAIDSVLAQSYPHIEVIAVDDGSTDDSIDVLSGYGERVRTIRQENRGVSAARNRGIQESRGELIAFLDADDVWLPQKIARQLDLFDDPAVSMVSCELRYVDASGRTLGETVSDLDGDQLRKLALLRGTGVPGAGSSAIVRRSVLDRVGLFDEALSTSADWDMCRRVTCHGRIAIVHEAMVLYRQHGSAMHRNVSVYEKDMLHAFESMFRDQNAQSVHPLRKRCYGNLYLTLAGSYFHNGRALEGAKRLARAAITWPPSLGRLFTAPVRRLERLLPGRTPLGRVVR